MMVVTRITHLIGVNEESPRNHGAVRLIPETKRADNNATM